MSVVKQKIYAIYRSDIDDVIESTFRPKKSDFPEKTRIRRIGIYGRLKTAAGALVGGSIRNLELIQTVEVWYIQYP